MSRISGVAAPPSPNAVGASERDLRSASVDDFLQLMITELQNQDPLDPVENSELLQQLSIIREISATDQLSQTLGSVLQGQGLATAGQLVGKTIRGLSDDGNDVHGVVDRVSFTPASEDGQPPSLKVHVEGQEIAPNNIREVTR